MTDASYIAAVGGLMNEDLDPMEMSEEEIRAEYNSYGFDYDADSASVRALLDSATEQPGRVLIFVGEHAEDLLAAARHGHLGVTVAAARDEVILAAMLSLHKSSEVIIAALDTISSGTSSEVLTTASRHKSNATFLRIRAAASYRRDVPLDVSDEGMPRLSRPVLVAGPLPQHFEYAVSGIVGPDVVVHGLRPNTTLPPDPRAYGLIVCWKCQPEVEQWLALKAPNAVMINISDSTQLVSSTWAILPLHRAVAQLGL
jgi:hypothetical protein